MITPSQRDAKRDEAEAGPAQAVLTHLTGRDTEVGLLKDRWEQAQEGMGQVVLIVGEPGLGKSRLVRTIKEHVLSGEGLPSPAVNDPGISLAGESSFIEWRCSHSSQNTEFH